MSLRGPTVLAGPTLGGLPGAYENMVAAPSPPRRASLASPNCPHSRFLTSDFQFLLAPALSTVDCQPLTGDYELSTFSLTLSEPISMWRAWKRKSSGLKLFGMSKCTAKTQEYRPCKCPGMCNITKYAGLISFRISVCKKPGGGVPPLCAERWKIRG